MNTPIHKRIHPIFHSGDIPARARRNGFDVNKPLATLDGDDVVIHAVEPGHQYPLIGEVYDFNAGVSWLARWNEAGQYRGTLEAVSKHSMEKNVEAANSRHAPSTHVNGRPVQPVGSFRVPTPDEQHEFDKGFAEATSGAGSVLEPRFVHVTGGRLGGKSLVNAMIAALLSGSGRPFAGIALAKPEPTITFDEANQFSAIHGANGVTAPDVQVTTTGRFPTGSEVREKLVDEGHILRTVTPAPESTAPAYPDDGGRGEKALVSAFAQFAVNGGMSMRSGLKLTNMVAGGVMDGRIVIDPELRESDFNDETLPTVIVAIVKALTSPNTVALTIKHVD